ncbi:MAG: AAA family ATPase [Planctomycetes bacterium]|nr:AAA family ATPase [Planctomycetota bacterium]
MNPFRQSIVASPWEATPADVPEIHSQAFNHCVAGVEFVRSQQRSAALLIHGEAGSGKTHLLSRLRTRMAPCGPSATYRQECLYVWVRLQTSPRMIWRTLRRTLVDDWFRPVVNSKSQFQRILFHRLAELRPAEWDLERWYEFMLEEDPEGLARLVDQIADTLDLDRNTAVAFQHIAFGRHLRDLRAWLAGTSLPQAALERLDLAQDDGSDEEREDEARQVVLMLCRLAGNELPVVMCFDQVEALQTAPEDHEALFAFGQLVSTLHDGTTNVLLVSCVQTTFLTKFRDSVRGADYDRLTSLGTFSLDPLNRKQAEQLIARRLMAAGATRPVDGDVAACWPLEPAEFEALLARGFIAPRQLISLCAERFEAREHPRTDESVARSESTTAAEAASPDAASVSGSIPIVPTSQVPVPPSVTPTSALTAALAPPDRSAGVLAEWTKRLQAKREVNTPDLTDEILSHALPLLAKVLNLPRQLIQDDQLKDVPVIFDGPPGVRIGLSFCTQANMTSLAAQLKRLKAQVALKRLAKLLVIRDLRIPISENAKAARQYLVDLEDEHALIVHPTVETLASLDALRTLLSDARTGDLEYAGERISPEAAEDWLSQNLPAELQEFGRLALTVEGR